jgi:hypothetical protein
MRRIIPGIICALGRGSGEKNAPLFLASRPLSHSVGGGWVYDPCFRLADGEPASLRGGGCDAGCCRSHKIWAQNMGALPPNQVCAIARGDEGRLTVAWFISYRHSLRPDEAGVKFVLDRATAIVEGQRLETLGYVVTRIAQSPVAERARVEGDRLVRSIGKSRSLPKS